MSDGAGHKNGPTRAESDRADRFIESLAEDLEPVRPLPRLRSAFAVVLAIWAAFLGLGLLGGSGLRAASSLGHFMYAASFAGLVTAVLGGTVSALAAGVPGRERTEHAGLGLAFAGLMAAAVACLLGMDEAVHAAPAGLDGMCFRKAAWTSLLPAGVIFAFLVRGWATRPVLAAGIALLASGALGAVLVHLSCGHLGARHVLMSHLSVPIVLVLLGLYPLGVLLRRLRG